jgi:hypothetical protein
MVLVSVRGHPNLLNFTLWEDLEVSRVGWGDFEDTLIFTFL